MTASIIESRINALRAWLLCVLKGWFVFVISSRNSSFCSGLWISMAFPRAVWCPTVYQSHFNTSTKNRVLSCAININWAFLYPGQLDEWTCLGVLLQQIHLNLVFDCVLKRQQVVFNKIMTDIACPFISARLFVSYLTKAYMNMGRTYHHMPHSAYSAYVSIV